MVSFEDVNLEVLGLVKAEIAARESWDHVIAFKQTLFIPVCIHTFTHISITFEALVNAHKPVRVS